MVAIDRLQEEVAQEAILQLGFIGVDAPGAAGPTKAVAVANIEALREELANLHAALAKEVLFFIIHSHLKHIKRQVGHQSILHLRHNERGDGAHGPLL